MRTSHSLFYRETPRGEDVAEAISKIVTAKHDDLPLAIKREDVLTELMIMSATKDNGEVVEQSASAKKFVHVSYWNTLTESTVFQSGYERYEDRSRNPVVPVTEYFFKYVYTSSDDDLQSCLDVMRPIEVLQSLPKRPSNPRDVNGAAINHELVEGADGQTLRVPVSKVGKVAGIVIFKPMDAAHILDGWIDRKRNQAFGLFERVTENISHARGEEAVGPVRGVTSDLRRVLPKMSGNDDDEDTI